MTPDEFGALFSSFERSAFRLETRQTYDIPAEAEELQRFLAGHPLPEYSVRTSPWLRNVADTTAAGRVWNRVRIVSHPLTDYTRYELACFAAGNLPAGERIRIGVSNEHRELDGLAVDWWGFDLEGPRPFVALMRYTYPRGAYLGAELVRDQTTIDQCRWERDHAMSVSVPLLDYLATVPA